MKKIVFLGLSVHKNDIHPGVHVSGNKMQNGIISALHQFYGKYLSILSVYPIASFPKTKCVFIKSGPITLDGGISARKIGFINLFFIKQITQAFQVWKMLGKVICKNGAQLVICFNPYWIFTKPLFYWMKKKSVKAVCVVADIPVTVPSTYGRIKKALRRYEIKTYHDAIAKFDGLIVLNQQVPVELAPNVPFVVMDGGVTSEEIQEEPLPSNQHNWNRLLFTGALEKYNCIQEMIEAFLAVDDPALELVICGSGTLADYVEKAAEKNPRIYYLGNVDNKKAKLLQRSAGLLLNIRKPDEYAMRLTFPSKLIEYMLSGTPVLTTRLNGISNAYAENLYLTDFGKQDLADRITEITTMPVQDRMQKALDAREYIVQNKQYVQHYKVIVPFLENL